MLARTLTWSILILAMAVAPAIVSCRSTVATRADAGVSIERTARVQDGSTLGVGKRFTLPALLTLDGSRLDPAALVQGKRGAVFVMTSAGCPVSTKYAPRVAALEREYAARGVAFVYVNAVAAETPAEMREQIKEFEFKGPYLPDREGEASLALGARTTTETFVFDPTWTLVYRGAVDDQFGVGTARDRPQREFLRAALAALVDGATGAKPEVAATWPPGCLIDRPRTATAGNGSRDSTPTTPGAPADVPTYYGRIARILDASCVDCHRTGGSAPFNLFGPSSFEGRTAMVEGVVRDGLMPPSHGMSARSSDGSEWANQVVLSSSDRDALLKWLRAGRPLGNLASAPAPRPRTPGWATGSPDMLYMTPGLRLPVDGPLIHGRFALPMKLESDQWLSAVEFRPVKAGTIHHALIWLVPPGAAVPAPSEFPGCEAGPQGGSGAGGIELLGVYSPGHDVVRYDEPVRRRIAAGSTLMVDVYARPMGKLMNVSLRVAMRVTPAPPPSSAPPEVRSFRIQANALAIKAGDARATHAAEWTLPHPARLIALTPYMRGRGRSIAIEARLPSGEVRPLLDAPRYDFRWQIRYEFAHPPNLPAGTRLVVRGMHDNSNANPNNPNAEAEVRCGAGAADEALMGAAELEVVDRQ